jgi:large subunit ribosomal protein L29
MDVAELRDLNDVELSERHDELKEDLFNLRFQLATGQLDNPTLLKQTRRDIARVLTVQRERELAAAREEAESDSAEAVA